jgi:hypothetical protein
MLLVDDISCGIHRIQKYAVGSPRQLPTASTSESFLGMRAAGNRLIGHADHNGYVTAR